MSWPGGYSGGGQIFPHAKHMQHTNARQLQIMQMQMQLQQKLLGQKPQFTNQSKNVSDKGNSPSKSNGGSSALIKSERATPVTSNDKNTIAMRGKDEAAKNTSPANPSDLVKSSQTTNKSNLVQAPSPNSTSDKANMKATAQPLIKTEPPSPQTLRQGTAKNSLLGNPPALMPNPPSLPIQEPKDDKKPFSKDFRNQSQQQPYSSNIQHNRSSSNSFNERQKQGNDHQRGAADRAGSHWQSQQCSTQSGSLNDRQSQQDKNYNAQQDPASSSDNSKGIGGSHQDNTSYNRQGRNMKAPYDRQSKNVPPYVKREPKGNYGFENKGQGYYGMSDRIKEKMEMAFSEPLTNLEPLDASEKKFNAYSKVFIGNIPKHIEQEELLAMFKPHGEIGPTYINKDSAFGFITFDYKVNAAKAVRELDNHCLKNRYLKVRFAAINEGLRVRNLSPYTSNELLEKAFSVFGAIETCRVLVDDRGNPKFEGIVIFKEKRCAALALKKCQEECFFLSGAMRPIIATALEPSEDNVESLPESVIPQNEEYLSERKVTPHLADQSSFEFEFGNQWKKLYEMYDEKKAVLDRDFQIELQRLEKKMVLAKVEYETDKLRRELAEREAQTAQLRRHFGGDEYGGRQSSPGGFNSTGSTSAEYGGGYGKMDQGYEAGYGALYSEGYDNLAGYGKPTAMVSGAVDDYKRGYAQQSGGYGTGYERAEYGVEAADEAYGSETKYHHSASGYDNRPVDPTVSDQKSYGQQYEAVPEPPTFTNSPEPSLAKDSYQAPNKRPRY